MRKEAEEAESPNRSIRDSGYIDCWDSERSDSLSPPRHGREDSFDSLDSFGSRSRQTPSPDVLGPRGSSDGRGSDSESDGPHRKTPDVRKDDMLARRTSVTELRTAMPFNQYLPNKSNQSGYVPTPLRKKKGEKDKEEVGRKSWSTATSPVGGDKPFRSVSMIDMRGEDELQPHSQQRHELMHNQYNRLKEEEDHWQDDLARWKSRRRSVSQDLIKKEEERKMMEQLMSGEGVVSQRRRSIKTYREIVEDKERREEDLRLAYRSAKTSEEATVILQRYAQRFSISEAVLERLQLPKVLDRSLSADPALCGSPFPLSLSLSASPTTPDPFDADPDGPLRYLRQQSAPPPKFTSTLETRVEEFPRDSPPHHRPQIRSRSSEPPSNRTLAPKPVPLLTPKPYFLSRPPAADETCNKTDGFLRVNGDVGSDDASPQSPGRESPPQFEASPSIDTTDAGESTSSSQAPPPQPGGGLPSTGEEGFIQQATPPTRPTSLPEELQKPQGSFGTPEGDTNGGQEEMKPNPAAQAAPPAEAKQEHMKSESWSEPIRSGINTQQQTVVHTQVRAPCFLEKSPNPTDPEPPRYHPPRNTATENAEKDIRGNEKYRQEQEKLKEEWERAQREVAEEEKKYHEEERRILEETVTPLTPPRSSSSASIQPQDTIVRSLADWERKQELLERQSRKSTENAEWKRRETDRTSDISTADDSMRTGRSLLSQSSSQVEILSHSLQNGQKIPPTPAEPSTATSPKQQEVCGEKTTDKRRSGSIDNNGSSKLRSACPPPSDSLPPAPNRSVSGKKLCSSCGQPLGKGAAMIIETLSLYFHIHCFKCGVCKGQLGDTTTGTDVRIRNGLLNCHQCYIRSRSAGQPTTL